MSKDLQKRAAEMLLGGATLLSEPCPYCKGVRVMKEGQALCIQCGREPEKRDIPKEKKPEEQKPEEQKPEANSLKKTLEKKLELLSKELEQETDHEKQQAILKTINSIIETIDKI